MQFFLNELTLHAQYPSSREFEQAIICLLSIAKKIQDIDHTKELFSDRVSLAGFKPTTDKYFLDSLREIDVFVRQRFKVFIYETLDNWRNSQIHLITDNFTVGLINVTDKSVAELAQRKLANATLHCALLNFLHSNLHNRQSIVVSKNGSVATELDCIDNNQTLQDWISCHVIGTRYDFSSRVPPTDDQTILRQSALFAKTTEIRQGRAVFREKKTGQFWYVDNLHHGTVAHIEVFDQHGKHIGESDLGGNIDFSKRDPAKEY